MESQIHPSTFYFKIRGTGTATKCAAHRAQFCFATCEKGTSAIGSQILSKVLMRHQTHRISPFFQIGRGFSKAENTPGCRGQEHVRGVGHGTGSSLHCTGEKYCEVCAVEAAVKVQQSEVAHVSTEITINSAAEESVSPRHSRPTWASIGRTVTGGRRKWQTTRRSSRFLLLVRKFGCATRAKRRSTQLSKSTKSTRRQVFLPQNRSAWALLRVPPCPDALGISLQLILRVNLWNWDSPDVFANPFKKLHARNETCNTSTMFFQIAKH